MQIDPSKSLSEQAADLLAFGAEIKAMTPLSRMPAIAQVVEPAVIIIAQMAQRMDEQDKMLRDLMPYADEDPAPEVQDDPEAADRAAFEAFKAQQAADADPAPEDKPADA